MLYTRKAVTLENPPGVPRMKKAAEAEMVRRLKSVCDSSLRSIVYLDPERREVLYVRDDIAPVSEDRLKDAFQTLMLDTISADSDVATYAHGDLLCVSRRFENAIELHFPLSGTEAVAVGLDGDALKQYDDPIPHFHRVIMNAR